MKPQSTFTVFNFWFQKIIFAFLFSYGSCFRPRSRTKRSARKQTKIICCFWLLQTTNMEEIKGGSSGPPVQTSTDPALPYLTRAESYHRKLRKKHSARN